MSEGKVMQTGTTGEQAKTKVGVGKQYWRLVKEGRI